MNALLVGAIVMLVIILIVREIQIRRGLPEPDHRDRDELEKIRTEMQELIVQHTADLLEREATHQQEMRDTLAGVDAEKHRLQVSYAETKRSDAKRSNALSRQMLVAKIAEHMTPLLAGFPYNPKEVRHIGELFDYLVLDGLEDGKINKVVFLEVKTRRTGRVSNPREKLLREAIRAGRVTYEVFVPTIPPSPEEPS